ncbi:MAG: preprotein translocase subunit SecG [Pseudomonadota bacterium]
MTTVILTFHTLIVLALIGVVLLQRSEGGALGMGGGGGGGGFMTGRGAANALTRTTSILAAMFFATSISLAVLADRSETDADVVRELTGDEVRDPNAAPSIEDLRGLIGSEDDDADASSLENATPSAPANDGPASDAETAPQSGGDALPSLDDALGASEGDTQQR